MAQVDLTAEIRAAADVGVPYISRSFAVVTTIQADSGQAIGRPRRTLKIQDMNVRKG
jgi:hypothetical protein